MRLLLPAFLFIAYQGCIHQPQVAQQQLGIVGSLPAFLLPQPQPTAFPYGIASGDPLPDAIILWTMLSEAAAAQDSLVYWELSQFPNFLTTSASGLLAAKADRHYRVKIDVRNLSPNTIFYYRFRNGSNNWSTVGRTKTAPLPSSQEPVQLAIVSCNALEWVYFNAFEQLATYSDLAAVVHLGDYIYEYASGEYGDTTLGRIHQPMHEVVSEQDYHQRYAQYRSDPQLQAAHAAHPFICVWDDHEVANNSHLYGAENHQEEEGDYLHRMTAAKQVYYDWMPVREDSSGQLYRSFQFGEIANLHMLDERLAGRTAPAKSFHPDDLADTSLHILGEQQLNWLCSQLKQSTTKWQLLGNQVLFAQLDLANILPQYAVNIDAWDGFRYEKQRLLDTIQSQRLQNILFLTGDTHCSWYFKIPLTTADGNTQWLHEFGTPSVSSANYDEFISGWDTLAVARYRLFRDNPSLEYTNLVDHGYLLLQLSPTAAKVEFHYLKTIRQRSNKEKAVTSYTVPYVSKHPS